MAEIRKGEVTMKGNPVDLIGPRLKAGDQAPDFSCATKGEAGLAVLSLKDTAGKARLFSVVPSLDTPVCSVQTKTLSKTLAELGDKVGAYTISMDLPFAMARFCADAGVVNMTNLSDLHNHSFGEHYGVLMHGTPVPLLTRALFVVDPSGTIVHAEYVKEVTNEPDYGPAIEALKKAAGA
ncbi:thiol peroxidase [Tautonia sociabilis]|uniref:Thiol peroxidase n=1 Tax=Tautonia sociabilis TaxID=2080755 RepID=A0A432MLQ9_9BACT|nr:thiol peroxidase [Tautonia sociabilis]RUL88332.1 thiol peroxidase [Tautonia sociabilis]